MPYQNIPRFEPNYGNRYGFRQRVSAPSTGPATTPVPGSPSAPPAPTTTGGSTRPSSDYHSGPSAESDGNQGIDAGAVRADAAAAQGLTRGQMTPGQIASGFAGLLPGGGLIGGYLGDAVDKATNFGGIPEHERYGAGGTYDAASGGVFNASGQAFDPITGEGLGVYRDRDAFLGGEYVRGIRENPFSIQSYLSDPVNAQRNTAANAAQAAGARGAQGFLAATRGERGLYGGQDDTGGGLDPIDSARLAQHVGQTDYGFAEHTVSAGDSTTGPTATNLGIQGVGYRGDVAPVGSQFSSTGVFSSSHSDSGDDNNISSDTYSDAEDEETDAFDDFSYDAPSDSGGGGGK